MINIPYEEHGELKLLDSHFGNILCGKYKTDFRDIANYNMITVLNVNTNLDIIMQNNYSLSDGVNKSDKTNNDIARLFALDIYGEADSTTDVTAEQLIDKFNSQIKYIDRMNQYIFPLMLCSNPPIGLPNNLK